MGSPTIEKYERILAADPRSRIFVELARALLEAGDVHRAAEICERGVEHHPDSVQGRILWGRALLRLERTSDAIATFEAAIAREPASSYAYDLAAEALLKHRLAAQARELLERASELRPGDARIRAWLEEARRAEGPAPAPPVSPPSQDRSMEGAATAIPASPSTEEGPTSTSSLPPAVSPPDPEREVEAGPSTAPTDAPQPRDPSPDRDEHGQGSQPPPMRRNGARASGETSGLLALIPDAAPRPSEAAAVTPESPAPARDDEAAAAEAAQTYEHELRQKLLASEAPKPGAARRRAVAIAAVVVALAVFGGAGTYAYARAQRRAEEARNAVALARAGLARDTLGALREAARVLDVAGAGRVPGEASTLAAEVNALLAHDFADDAAAARARQLLASGAAGEGALVARTLVAAGDERNAAEAALLEATPGATPLARAVAGELLAARGDAAGAREQLDAAARASPPLLRALARLGDLDLARGAPERALETYDAALRAHATHPRTAVGAAEARLALGRELPEALRALEAVEADPASAVPIPDRLRFDLALARLLSLSGRSGDAERRLAAAAERNPERAEVAAAQAEVFARSGDVERALRAAQGAVRLAPRDAAHRELLARLQLQSGRYRELLASTEGAPTRALLLDRGVARLALGDPAGARAELEATRRDGKMPAEAAAWLALAQIAMGHRAQAAAITGAMLASANPHPLALVARARLDLAERRPDDAERRLRDALGRDPSLVEARVDLGALLLERGRAAEAKDVLARAVADAPFRADARRELGRARLATGDPAGAARELEAALAERPADAVALRSLVGAARETGDAAGARRAAERAVEADPRSATIRLAAGEAAAAQGDARAAHRYFAEAAKLGLKGADAIEAKRALANANRLPRR